MKQAKHGIWTPWARVMCYTCHGPKFPRQTYDTNSEEWQNLITPCEVDKELSVTFCDGCGCDIQVDEAVAHEHNLVRKLAGLGYESHMDQTGGMCSACSVDLKDEGWLLITYNWEADGKYWVGRYDKDGDWQEDDAPVEGFSTDDEVVKYIESIKDDVKPNESKLMYQRVEEIVAKYPDIANIGVLEDLKQRVSQVLQEMYGIVDSERDVNDYASVIWGI